MNLFHLRKKFNVYQTLYWSQNVKIIDGQMAADNFASIKQSLEKRNDFFCPERNWNSELVVNYRKTKSSLIFFCD